MKKIILGFMVLVLFTSCVSRQKGYLLYNIINNDGVSALKKEINSLQYLNRELLLVFGKEGDFNKITIIAITNEDKKIQNLRVKDSNRVMKIGKDTYNVVFDFDYELGVSESKIFEDGEYFIKKEKKVYINEYSIQLYFDKDWNYLKTMR